MNDTNTEEISRLIHEWRGGNSSAEQHLFDALYKALYVIALGCLRAEAPDQSLGATALVHEAYLRLRRSQRLSITDRNHFLRLCSRVMRRILVDRARARRAQRRDVGGHTLEIVEDLIRTDAESDRILEVDLALETLAGVSPRQAAIVELRYFAGYSVEESATILGISDRTVRREWQIARIRLRHAIDGSL